MRWWCQYASTDRMCYRNVYRSEKQPDGLLAIRRGPWVETDMFVFVDYDCGKLSMSGH